MTSLKITLTLIPLAIVFPLWAQESKPEPPRAGRKALLPDISAVGSIAGAWFQDDPVGDQGENPSRTGFNLQGIEVALQSVVDPYVRADLFLLFKEDAVEIEEGAITTLSLPWNLQVRAGKLLGKFGRQNSRHLEQLSFVDQSLANRYFFGPEGFSEMGGEVSWLMPTPWFSEITFELLQGENGGNFDGDRKQDLAYLGRWANSFDLSPTITLLTGLSGVIGFNDTAPGNMTQIYGGDLFLRWRPSERRGLKWQTEYFLRRRETAAATDWEGGLYTELVGQFARRWETGIRYDFVGLPEEGFRQRRAAPVLTFLATEFFHVRAQYGLLKTDGAAYRHEAFLQLQFNMGPHGAHAF